MHLLLLETCWHATVAPFLPYFHSIMSFATRVKGISFLVPTLGPKERQWPSGEPFSKKYEQLNNCPTKVVGIDERIYWRLMPMNVLSSSFASN